MASERTGSAKLTVADVHFIRSQRGKILQKDLAAMYGVCQKSIVSIMQNVTWKRTGPTPEIAVCKAIVAQSEEEK